MHPAPWVRRTSSVLERLVPIGRRWLDRPPAALAVHAVVGYVALSTLASGVQGLLVRLEGGAWLAAGDADDPFYEMGTSLGFWGMLFFGLNFVLATRWRWIERLLGGLDRVYRLHAYVGKATLTMVVLHVGLLVVQALPNTSLMATYLVPGVDLGYTAGLLGVAGLTVLVLLTIWARLAYHSWYQSHRLMGIPYVLGGTHAIVLQGDWYMVLLTAVGGYAWVYDLYLHRRLAPPACGRLLSNTRKGDVDELLIRLDQPLSLRPGQFVFLSVSASAHAVPDERHPFSVSQIVDAFTLRVSAKTLGDYTAQLRRLVPGDRLAISGPHGTFGDRAQASGSELLWIAGGIGITPFLSMLHAEASASGAARRRRVHLVWGVRAATDAVYDDEIRRLVAACPHVSYHLHVGRLDHDRIVRTIGTDVGSAWTVALCGPVPMMRALSEQLRARGVPSGRIVGEEFALR